MTEKATQYTIPLNNSCIIHQTSTVCTSLPTTAYTYHQPHYHNITIDRATFHTKSKRCLTSEQSLKRLPRSRITVLTCICTVLRCARGSDQRGGGDARGAADHRCTSQSSVASRSPAEPDLVRQSVDISFSIS